jgi:hypothetical protein
MKCIQNPSLPVEVVECKRKYDEEERCKAHIRAACARGGKKSGTPMDEAVYSHDYRKPISI